MPPSVVKDSGDERHWRKAKELAAEQGKAGDYAYIMGIFQKMSGKKSLTKSFTVPPSWRGSRIPGQVPGQGGRNLERLLDMPKPQGGLAMLEHTEPRLTPESVVKGLGLDLATENDWRGWLTKNLASAQNEVVVRKALYSRFLEDKTPPELRRALFQRAMVYYGGLRKSTVEIVTPDEILEKARSVTPVGGVTAGGYRKVKEGQYAKMSLEDWKKLHGPHHPHPAQVHHAAKHELEKATYTERTGTPGHYQYKYGKEYGNEHRPHALAWHTEQMQKLRSEAQAAQAAKKLDEARSKNAQVMQHKIARDRWRSTQRTGANLSSGSAGFSGDFTPIVEGSHELGWPGPLEKAEARGGSYHRRVKTEKGYRYYYDPEKYESREDAHTSGDSALKKRLQKMCVSHAEKAGEAGCGMESFKALAARFGADKVAEALRAASSATGPLEFNKGYFRMRQLQKSARFIITR